MNQVKILRATAREILDSRGNPTVEASVYLSDGTVGCAAVPSGASTGSHEKTERRDGDPARFGGKGVLQAVEAVSRVLSPALTGIDAFDQTAIDAALVKADGTEDRSRLGANALLSVSIAAARAGACALSMPLYRYLGGVRADHLPVPMMNILNGGKHASNNIDIQEFMILPLGAESFAEGVRICAEIYATLRRNLSDRHLTVAVGDEGGFAPDLSSDREAIEEILRAIRGAGYSTDTVGIALDAAAAEWTRGDGYYLPKRGVTLSREELIAQWQDLIASYPIVSLEDPLGEDDFAGWHQLTEAVGGEVLLVGDDLFVTDTHRLARGIEEGCGNAILIKPNQIGTVTETLDVIALAAANGYRHILSHRSGETEDTTIADLAVATGAGFIKSGAPARGERVSKYNRLMKIERALSRPAYGAP